MTHILDTLMEQMVLAFVEGCNPEHGILFGSHIQAGSSENLDGDLFVLEEEPFGVKGSRQRESLMGFHALAGFAVTDDVLVNSKDDVNYLCHSLNDVLPQAVYGGTVLYE